MATKTILIADDDQSLVAALSIRLDAEGFSVITSQDAYQAIAMARREKPDLLLLDVNMPAGDGFSVQERLRNIDELASTPVIYITGDPPEKVDKTAQEYGAFAVVHKPFETSELLDTIRAAFGYWSGASPAPASAKL